MVRNIAVIGSGAREHALAEALLRSGKEIRVVAYPGNDGMAQVDRGPELPPDPQAAARILVAANTALAIVGPEKPLMEGLGNALRDRGVPVVGPNGEAARIEGSKIFGKELMGRVGIPTAPWQKVSGRDEATALLKKWGLPLVFKADGLAQGKGVTVVATRDDWESALERYFDRKDIPGSDTVLIERALSGPEISFIVVTDGKRFVPCPTARDYKRVADGDVGPNTGGMGVLTPVPEWSPILQGQAMEIIERCLWGMSKTGTPFSGFLYAGLMLTPEGLSVLEFNARMGDPEGQVLFETLGEAALPLLEEVGHGEILSEFSIAPVPRVGVVLASEGYPEKPRTGDPVDGLPRPGTMPNTGALYFAGVRKDAGILRSSGGRVLTAVGRGNTLPEARTNAYDLMGTLRLEGGHFRSDIALKETIGQGR